MLQELKDENILDKEFKVINQNVLDFSSDPLYDFVIMNPPYGTKDENIDKKFV